MISNMPDFVIVQVLNGYLISRKELYILKKYSTGSISVSVSDIAASRMALFRGDLAVCKDCVWEDDDSLSHGTGNIFAVCAI